MKKKLISLSLAMSIAALEAERLVRARRSAAPLGFDPKATATTIDNYGTELTQVQPPAYAPLKPNQYEGRLRIAVFTRVYGTEAAGDDTALCIIPAKSRIIAGFACVDATTGSATLAFGLMGKDGTGYIDDTLQTSDATNSVKAAAAITTTAMVDLFATQALLKYYETTKDLYLTVTTAAAAMAGQTLKGHVLYVRD